jgi:hypothetical protein
MSNEKKEITNKRCEKSLLQVKVSKTDYIYLINPLDNEVMRMDNLKKRRRCLVIFLIIIILSIVATVFFGFFACNEEMCAFSKKKLFPDHHFHQYQVDNLSTLNKHKQLDSHLKGLSYDEVLNDDFQSKFDINKFDVMVRKILFCFICYLNKHSGASNNRLCAEICSSLFQLFPKVFLHIQKVK